jgi:hypothetical protein
VQVKERKLVKLARLHPKESSACPHGFTAAAFTLEKVGVKQRDLATLDDVPGV